MTTSRWEGDPSSTEEAERLFKFIGEYVTCFQWLEGEIDEMIILGRGQEFREKTLGWLSQRTNAQKIDAFFEMVTSPTPFGMVPIDGWLERLKALVDRLHDERRRRNGILHSQFLFDFLAIGASVLRTNARRQGGELVFDHEDLTNQRCDQIMRELADLALEVNMVCVQLLHLYRRPK